MAKLKHQDSGRAGKPPRHAGRLPSEVVLKKVGGSLVMTVPAKIRDELELTSGQSLKVAVEDHRIVVEPKTSKPRYTLSQLLAECSPEAEPATEEIAWRDARPVGREIW